MDKAEREELRVSGMTCNSCARTVSNYLEKQGLSDIYVNFATDEVSFSNSSQKKLPDIIKGINSLGYNAEAVNLHAGHEHASGSSLEKRLLVVAIFTIPLLLHMFLDWHWLHNPYVQLALAIPPMVIGFLHFGKSAWGSLKERNANMDVLIFIGSFSAFFYSLYGTLAYKEDAHNYLFYETGASIIMFVLLGNLLEQRSVRKTSSAIDGLSKLRPQKAHKVLRDLVSGKEETIEVNATELRVGDMIRVNSGEIIPVDGLIVSGEADADESMITGESIPLEKNPNSELKAGTTLINGNVLFRASRVGNDTTLSQIIHWVKMAQTEKSRIQQLCDKISNVFVPLVVLIAIATFTGNYLFFDKSFEVSMMRAVAVMVIACPCALGLATPTATVVGLGKAARKGVLIKGAGTAEQLASIKHLIFDKTGTLTSGDFRIDKFEAIGNEAEAKSLVYTLEGFSAHPIAKSIRKHYKDWALSDHGISGAEEIRGKGLKARDKDGNEYFLGSASSTGQSFDKDLYLIRNGQLLASFNIVDELKEGALEMLKRFRSQGVNIVLLSGDNERKCAAVAQQLGIPTWFSEHTPDMKLEKIRHYTKQGKTAMVGDGINDAPALTLADVGISVGAASDIARQAAAVVLMHNSSDSIWEAYTSARLTHKTIKQNLFWAFFYNIVAIPFAAAGYLSPIFGALIMAGSDVVIIGNSLLLRFKTFKS